MAVKINELEIENLKRVKAVQMTPSAAGLTVIGGNNNQGKTSVLDAIAWALGGNSFRPSQPHREGSVSDPYLHVVLSNGLVVERKGKNSDLKVTDPTGNRAGQQILDGFISKLALDLPKFMQASDSEKANTLLNIIGVKDQLTALEKQENDIYQERTAIGRIADQKKKYAEEQTYYPDVPQAPVSASELIRQQQEILARNGENQRKRDNLEHIKVEKRRLEMQIADLREKLEAMEAQYKSCADNELTAEKTVAQLQDESTSELEESIAQIDETNRKVRANLDKDKAEEDAKQYADQYNNLTKQIEDIRKQKKQLLDGAKLPLPGLTVEGGKLLYNGHPWDGMSGSDQLKVATAIVRKLNPECGFVLLDKLEQMDRNTLAEFGAWLEEENLQCIATRVSNGDECSIIVTDGYSESTALKTAKAPSSAWKEGEF